MHPDIRTLVLVLGITHIIQIFVFSYQYLTNRNYKGIGWWLMWSAAEVSGFTFILLRELPSIKLIAIICQNTSIILGVIFLYTGIVRFFGKKENRWIVISIFTVFFAAFLHFIFADNDIRIRGIIISATLAIVSFLSAHALLFYRTRSVASSANFIAVFFLAHGGFFVFRTVELFKKDINAEPFIPSVLNIATYIDALVCSILWTIALIIMINQRLNAEMKEAKEEIEMVFNTSPDAAAITRMSDGLIVYANEGFSVLSGFPGDEVIGKSSLAVNVWENPGDRNKVVNELNRRGSVENFEAGFQRKDGSKFIGLMSAKIINLQNVPHIISITRDITDRKQAEALLRESEERYRVLVEYSNDGVALVEGDQNVYVNQKFLDIFGYEKSEDIIGKSSLTVVHPDDREMVMEYNRKRLKGESIPLKYEFKGIRKDGTILLIEVSVAKIAYHGKMVSLAYLRNITERKLLEEQLQTMSLTDDLTGLYNRRGFFALAQQQLKLAERTKKNALIFFADLDRMKQINDTLGHQEGDKALIEIASILKGVFRESDIIGRMGGDEFAVLAINTMDETGEVLRNRLDNTLEEYNRPGNRNYLLSLSIGLAYHDPEKPSSLDELIAQADIQMYEEKRKKQQ
jgi:diguanylate cyclase (GGDEF)-like protein/PAS domain S-box-containing protein